jgi:hypothetical protein
LEPTTYRLCKSGWESRTAVRGECREHSLATATQKNPAQKADGRDFQADHLPPSIRKRSFIRVFIWPSKTV